MNAATTTDSAAPAQPAKGKGRKILLFTTAALVVGGGGVGAGLYATGHVPFVAQGPVEDPNQPQLVPRDGVSSGEVAAARARALRGEPDPRVFKATYLPLEGNFTSNLGSGGTFVQLGLGLSTFYDERVAQHVETHEMAIRSAILMTLSQADPNVVASVEGKQALKRELRNAVNAALTNKEGFGGIHEVHFTSFLMQ